MRVTSCVAVAAVSAVLLGGCGKGGDDRAHTVGQPVAGAVAQADPTRVPQPLSAKRAHDALLTVTDLQTGWSVKPDDGSSQTSSSDEYAQCPEYGAVAKKVSKKDNVQAAFTTPVGSNVDEDVLPLSESEAAKVMAAFSHAVSACKQLRGTTPGGTMYDMYLTALSFPKLGDDTFAVRVSAKMSGTSVNMDMVLVRRGGAIIGIVQTVVGNMDTATTEDFARRALTKLDATLR